MVLWQHVVLCKNTLLGQEQCSSLKMILGSKHVEGDFDVLLTVHLNIFISVFNQLDAGDGHL